MGWKPRFSKSGSTERTKRYPSTLTTQSCSKPFFILLPTAHVFHNGSRGVLMEPQLRSRNRLVADQVDSWTFPGIEIQEWKHTRASCLTEGHGSFLEHRHQRKNRVKNSKMKMNTRVGQHRYRIFPSLWTFFCTLLAYRLSPWVPVRWEGKPRRSKRCSLVRYRLPAEGVPPACRGSTACLPWPRLVLSTESLPPGTYIYSLLRLWAQARLLGSPGIKEQDRVGERAVLPVWQAIKHVSGPSQRGKRRQVGPRSRGSGAGPFTEQRGGSLLGFHLQWSSEGLDRNTQADAMWWLQLTSTGWGK